MTTKNTNKFEIRSTKSLAGGSSVSLLLLLTFPNSSNTVFRWRVVRPVPRNHGPLLPHMQTWRLKRVPSGSVGCKMGQSDGRKGKILISTRSPGGWGSLGGCLSSRGRPPWGRLPSRCPLRVSATNTLHLYPMGLTLATSPRWCEGLSKKLNDKLQQRLCCRLLSIMLLDGRPSGNWWRQLTHHPHNEAIIEKVKMQARPSCLEIESEQFFLPWHITCTRPSTNQPSNPSNLVDATLYYVIQSNTNFDTVGSYPDSISH